MSISAATEKQVRMAAQLYEMRERMRRLLGGDFHPRMAEVGKLLQQRAKTTGRGVLETAIDLCNVRGYSGMDQWTILSAAVELTEPSA